MHQQALSSLPPLPHSNAVPQRAQARRRKGNRCSAKVCAMTIQSVALEIALPR
jgi:hypothetical protein